MTLSRRHVLRLMVGGAVLAGAPPAIPPAQRVYRRLGVAFGTTIALTILADSPTQAEAALEAAFASVRRMDRVASLRQPGSDVARLNRDGYLRDPDPWLIDMLAMTATMHEASGGLFDVTIQPLWLTLDRAAQAGSWPAAADIAALADRIGFRHVRFDPHLVRFDRSGMAVTLNSLAQGYALDQVALALTAHGIRDALIDTGALDSLGKAPQGGLWQADIQHPREDRAIGRCALTGCIATAGDYAYTWSDDFARNHIIHPHTGVSPDDFAAVSVQAATGLMADALSTTIFLVGRTGAASVLHRFGAEAHFVTKLGETSATPGFPILPA